MNVEKTTIIKRTEGFAAGFAAGAAVYGISDFASKKGYGFNKPVIKLAEKYNFQESEQNGIKTLEMLGLKDVVTIRNNRKLSKEEIEENLKRLKEQLVNTTKNEEIEVIKNNIARYEKAKTNGGYLYIQYDSFIKTPKGYKKGIIQVNFPKSGSNFYHEAGHAHNTIKSNTLGKILVKLSDFSRKSQFRKYYFPQLIFAAGCIGLISNKKEEKSKNIIGKTVNFIKNNPFKTALILSSPIMIEEARASFKGVNIAKKMLSKEKVKSLIKANTLAFMTYLNASLFFGLILFAGNKVRDKVAQR